MGGNQEDVVKEFSREVCLINIGRNLFIIKLASNNG
jgi:hypothetical protein